jgi:hypothetical protein
MLALVGRVPPVRVGHLDGLVGGAFLSRVRSRLALSSGGGGGEERRGEGGEKESEEGGRPACKAWTWRPSWSVQRAFFWEIGPLANRLPTGPDWRLGWPIWMNFSFELASDVDWERNQS